MLFHLIFNNEGFSSPLRDSLSVSPFFPVPYAPYLLDGDPVDEIAFLDIAFAFLPRNLLMNCPILFITTIGASQADP